MLASHTTNSPIEPGKLDWAYEPQPPDVQLQVLLHFIEIDDFLRFKKKKKRCQFTPVKNILRSKNYIRHDCSLPNPVLCTGRTPRERDGSFCSGACRTKLTENYRRENVNFM